MQITMKDIARMVGVSESTVSRAINNKKGVGEKTRKEILRLARKYNYKPNQLARSLAKQESEMIGLILPDIASSFYSEVARGIQDVAIDNGHQVIICNTDGEESEEIKYINWLQSNKVNGIIFLGDSLVTDQIIKLGLSGYPIVLANRLVEEVVLPSVIIDDITGSYKAIKHLLKEGYKEIALINGPNDKFIFKDRLEGYKRAIREYNINYKQRLVLNKECSREGGYQGFLDLVKDGLFPDAIFAANDLIAVGVVEAIKTGGYLIPNDIAVVGFGDTIVTSIIDPPLTTVAQPMYQLGVSSANKLFSLISKEEVEEKVEILESKLIIKKTT